jgi:hypothetical protein
VRAGDSRHDLSQSRRLGTSKAYAPDSLDNLSAFGFRGEGRISRYFPMVILSVSSSGFLCRYLLPRNLVTNSTIQANLVHYSEGLATSV